MCLFSEGLQGILYILSRILDRDLEADLSGDADKDCIKAENFLTSVRIMHCQNIQPRFARAVLDLGMNFFEICILQLTSE